MDLGSAACQLCACGQGPSSLETHFLISKSRSGAPHLTGPVWSEGALTRCAEWVLRDRLFLSFAHVFPLWHHPPLLSVPVPPPAGRPPGPRDLSVLPDWESPRPGPLTRPAGRVPSVPAASSKPVSADVFNMANSAPATRVDAQAPAPACFDRGAGFELSFLSVLTRVYISFSPSRSPSSSEPVT